MFIVVCSLYVHCMFIVCSLYVYCKLTVCMLFIVYVSVCFILYSLYVHCMHAHDMCIVCSLFARLLDMFTSLYVHCMFIACSCTCALYVHRMFIVSVSYVHRHVHWMSSLYLLNYTSLLKPEIWSHLQVSSDGKSVQEGNNTYSLTCSSSSFVCHGSPLPVILIN